MAVDVRGSRGSLGFYALIATAITGARMGSAILALSFTVALMIWLGLPHAPACVTTLIVALGLVHALPHIAILFTAVVLVVISAFLINRLAGIPVPWWRPPTP